MTKTPWWPLRAIACACVLLCGRPALAQINEPVDDKPPSLEALQRQLADAQARLGIGQLPLKSFEARRFVVYRLVDLRECWSAAQQDAGASNGA